MFKYSKDACMYFRRNACAAKTLATKCHRLFWPDGSPVCLFSSRCIPHRGKGIAVATASTSGAAAAESPKSSSAHRHSLHPLMKEKNNHAHFCNVAVGSSYPRNGSSSSVTSPRQSKSCLFIVHLLI